MSGRSEGTIQYEVMRAEHLPQVKELLLTSFFLEEPSSQMAGVRCPEDVEAAVDAFLPATADEGASFVAVELGADGSRGDVIGARVASIARRGVPDKGDPEAFRALMGEDNPLLAVLKLMEDVGAGVDMFAKYGTDTVLRMRMLSVRRSHSGRGIGAELVTRTTEHARDALGAGAVAAELTSAYSQRLYARLGYGVDREIVYDEYKDAATGKVVFDNKGSVHRKCQLVSRAL